MPRSIYYLLTILVLVAKTNVSAETIELETAENRTALATFLPGDNDASPILILHGFLQTREFSTVDRLANSLNESGHTILAPTLTLGLHKRRKSLACEAIHTHNTDTDTAEIAQWIEWLTKKTGKPVILIGHSSGTQTLLNYMAEHDENLIKEAIMVSMIFFGPTPFTHENTELAKRARQHLAAGRDPMDTYALSFCKTYPTRASNFLSYYEWDRDKVTSTATSMAEKLSVIIGTGDERIEKKWREELINKKINITVIESANHFFDHTHEFDLLDTIIELLED